jgi:hypothetical protein
LTPDGPETLQADVCLGSGAELREEAGVVAEDELALVVVERLELGEVVEGLGHALDVGPVGAEDHAVRASYAALLVRPEFDAFVRLDILPQIGGYVLARTIVEGKR